MNVAVFIWLSQLDSELNSSLLLWILGLIQDQLNPKVSSYGD